MLRSCHEEERRVRGNKSSYENDTVEMKGGKERPEIKWLNGFKNDTRVAVVRVWASVIRRFVRSYTKNDYRSGGEAKADRNVCTGTDKIDTVKNRPIWSKRFFEIIKSVIRNRL